MQRTRSASPNSTRPGALARYHRIQSKKMTPQDDNPEPSVTADEQAGDDLAANLDVIRNELADAQDRALRAHAELENYRKRVRREMDEERKYANLPLLRDLLPVIDNVGRAVAAAEKAAAENPAAQSLVEGFKLVAQQLDTVLGQYQCARIDAQGKPFDPHLHAAIAQQPSTDQPPGTVLVVAQDGWQLHERVIRPAQVIVSTTPTEPDA